MSICKKKSGKNELNGVATPTIQVTFCFQEHLGHFANSPTCGKAFETESCYI